MLEATYAVEAAVEEMHWWFVGRRQLFARELQRAGIARDARILDVGTGTGSNLRMLRDLRYSSIEGLDMSAEAIRWCTSKGLGPVRQGSISNMPFESESFDLILATDIIEHVDNDQSALEEIVRVLVPGGTALITVPAFPSLWGRQDDVSLHRRRYRMSGLLELVRRSGLSIRYAYHFNYLLFVPIWVARRIMRLARLQPHSEGQIRAPVLDQLFTAIFTLDILSAPWLHPPFGVSILVMASKQI